MSFFLAGAERLRTAVERCLHNPWEYRSAVVRNGAASARKVNMSSHIALTTCVNTGRRHVDFPGRCRAVAHCSGTLPSQPVGIFFSCGAQGCGNGQESQHVIAHCFNNLCEYRRPTCRFSWPLPNGCALQWNVAFTTRGSIVQLWCATVRHRPGKSTCHRTLL